MNHRPLILAALAGALGAISLAGCSSEPASAAASTDAAAYERVDAARAKEIMDTEDGYVILDVRTQAEYDEGHIPGAVLLPHDTIAEDAACALPDTDQLVLVYCRSGNRSKQAAQALADQGYTNVVEFGGIKDWPYEIE